MAGEVSDVFIAHASEDKDSVARPLAKALIDRGWAVWLDELQLTIGDSLSRRIDSALAKTRFGVVVLSPAFFAKEWPQRELAGLAAREINTGSKVILPAWHNVDHSFIVLHSPVLADRLGAVTSAGLEVVANEISLALAKDSGDANDRNATGFSADSEVRSSSVSMFEIPVTDDEQAQLVQQRRRWWEFLLYAGVLVQGRIELEDKWQNHELRLPGGPRRDIDRGSFSEFMSREIGWMRRQVTAIDRVFDPDVLGNAFGAPMEAGDATLIRGISRGVIQIYGSMMDWAATLRNTSVDEDYEEIVEIAARMVDGPVRQVREFVQLVADEIARIPVVEQEAAEQGVTTESPMTLTLALRLSLDDGVQEEFQAAIQRAN
jgi:hypothetical protein